MPTNFAPAFSTSLTRAEMVWPVARKSSTISILSEGRKNSGEAINSTWRPLV